MPHKDPEVARAYFKAYNHMRREKTSQYHEKYYQVKMEAIKTKSKAWYWNNVERASKRAKKYRDANKEELTVKAKNYRKKNREYICQKDREDYRKPREQNRILLRNFGITLEQFNAMSEARNHLCAICSRSQVKTMSRLSVDHCHKTGAVRGLLCTRCNTGIGMLEDSPEIAASAFKYLKSFEQPR